MIGLYQCAEIAQSLQHNIRPLFPLGLLCLYSEVWMYLTCQQQQNLIKNYTFFINSFTAEVPII